MASILVVDDSKFMSKALKRGLQGLGYQVLGVGHDGIQGLELFQQLNPEVVMLDVTMPNMDGLDCLSEILKLNSEARVIMLSAIQDEEVVQQCRDAGAIDYLQKPVRFDNQDDAERVRAAIEMAASE